MPALRRLRWGSVVGDGEIKPEQPQHAADESLSLPQGEMEDEPEHQDELDRWI